jgi:adenylate cyclase class 2
MTQPTPHFEVEQKFRATDLAALRQKLLALGAALAPPIDQADTYFSHPLRDFAQTDEALRLRRVGEHNWITYKGPKIDATTKTRRELELPLAGGTAAFDQFAQLLGLLGFAPVATVRKRRELASLTWQGRTIEVALDQVNGVGSFIELETSAAESELPAAKGAITSLASELGLTNSERRSYLELLLAGSP